VEPPIEQQVTIVKEAVKELGKESSQNLLPLHIRRLTLRDEHLLLKERGAFSSLPRRRTKLLYDVEMLLYDDVFR